MGEGERGRVNLPEKNGKHREYVGEDSENPFGGIKFERPVECLGWKYESGVWERGCSQTC